MTRVHFVIIAVIALCCWQNVFRTTKQIPKASICCCVQTPPFPCLFVGFILSFGQQNITSDDGRIFHWPQTFGVPERCTLTCETMQKCLSTKVLQVLLWRVYTQDIVFIPFSVIGCEQFKASSGNRRIRMFCMSPPLRTDKTTKSKNDLIIIYFT